MHSSTSRSTQSSASKNIRVHESQRGNALLKYLYTQRTKVVYVQSVHDYEPGTYFGVLYVSLRFHLSNPSYIYKRIEETKSEKTARHTVVLLLVDTEINTKSTVGAYSKMQVECMGFGIHILTSYSAAESAKYIETMHTQGSEQKDRFQNQSYAVRKQQYELEKAEIEYAAIDEYVRKTLFLAAVPNITSRDANILIPTYRTIKETVKRMCEGGVGIKGIGSAKQASFRSLMHYTFK